MNNETDRAVSLVLNAHSRGHAEGWQKGYEEGKDYGRSLEADKWKRQLAPILGIEEVDGHWGSSYPDFLSFVDAIRELKGDEE